LTIVADLPLCGVLPSHHAASTQLYSLSLHDALPISDQPSHMLIVIDNGKAQPPDERICHGSLNVHRHPVRVPHLQGHAEDPRARDRKSTRLNSSHVKISYAVFCLKKKIRIRPSRTRD